MSPVWVLLAFSVLDERVGSAAAEIIARHGDDPRLVTRAASLLIDEAERRPLDLAPFADGPERIAAMR
jgi:hypothetical protein